MDRYDLDYEWRSRHPQFDIECFGLESIVVGFDKNDTGDWCRWEDVEQLQSENTQLKEKLEKVEEEDKKNQIKTLKGKQRTS